MPKLAQAVILLLLFAIVAGISYLYGSLNSTLSDKRVRGDSEDQPLMSGPGSLPDLSKPFAFQELMPDECARSSVADNYRCIHEHLISLQDAIAALEDKLLMEAPVRAAALDSITNAPAPWEYGGSGFLAPIPPAIEQARLGEEPYVGGVCKLNTIYVHGSSGADLEFESCRYFYAQIYLSLLKRLEAGLTATGT